MTEEEQALLARIGQVAGQINRHKNERVYRHQNQQPASASNAHFPYQRRGGRYSSRRVNRGYRPTLPTHRHRTLQLGSGLGDASSSSSTVATDSPGWVSRSDRHLQLINSNVYEAQARSRAKAMEETRLKKLKTRRNRENSQFQQFLESQATSAANVTNANPASAHNDIFIEGIRFRVMNGGRKLVRSPDEPKLTNAISNVVFVAGVKFNRTKNGNLVVNRIVQSQRQSGQLKKIDELCKAFCSTGSCPKGPACRYEHDPHKVAVCKDFLKEGKCWNGDSCDLSHVMTPERVPQCLHFAKGQCTKSDCHYTHSQVSPSAPVCRAFGFRGYCEKGTECPDRHVFECPDFSNSGRCRVKGCRLPHRERASVLRGLSTMRDEAENEEEVSSEEEVVDVNDVDSDAVEELITAESDDSDTDDERVFIRV